MRTLKSIELSDIVYKQKPESSCLVSNERTYTYAQLGESIPRVAKQLESLQGKRVAIRSSTRTELARFLPAIESIASAILLEPSEIDQTLRARLYELGRVDASLLLEGGGLSFESVREKTVAKECAAAETEWLLVTSGTSGVPKLISHRLSSLISSAKRNLDSDKTKNWGLVYDINRFAGLQVYLQAMVAGDALVVAEQSMKTAEMVRLFAKMSVGALSATPSMWRKLLMIPELSSITFEQITLGGEIADQAILSALWRKFPESRIVHIYASTEAGVGFSVRDGRAGFPAAYVEKNNELRTVSLKVVDQSLWMKSSRLASSIDGNENFCNGHGYFDSGDLVEKKGDRFYFLGRESGSINVGGNKVMPEEVETALNDIEIVAASRVQSMPNPILGSIVKADIVLADGFPRGELTSLKKEIKKECRARLQNYQIPAVIKFVDELEITSSGKIARG